jgi:hypothetical protein
MSEFMVTTHVTGAGKHLTASFFQTFHSFWFFGLLFMNRSYVSSQMRVISVCLIAIVIVTWVTFLEIMEIKENPGKKPEKILTIPV